MQVNGCRQTGFRKPCQNGGMRKSAPKLLDYEGLLLYAQRVLSLRSYSEADLSAKLRARAAVGADAERVLTVLRDAKVVDDVRFAEALTTSRRDTRGLGPARIRRELQQKKIPKPLAESAVQEGFAEIDESAHALEFLKRKLRSPQARAELADPKKLQSALRKLIYGGFGMQPALAAIRRLQAEERLPAVDLESLADSAAGDLAERDGPNAEEAETERAEA